MDEAPSFKQGDTVRLKSGSPHMTVAEIEGDQVLCMWFEGSQHRQQRFPAATLTSRQAQNLVVVRRPPSRHSF